MNQYLQTPLGGGTAYVSPKLEIIEIDVENVLCQDSSKFTLPEWQYDGEDPLNW